MLITARLGPYARASFEQGAALAARIHAEEISSEHWLAAMLADESCAATRTVLHAFADPETIGTEVLALCAGIMVVGSARTLPFSVRGVEALRAAREGAVGRGAAEVTPADLLEAAWERLDPLLAARLAETTRGARAAVKSEGGRASTAREDALFRHFSDASKRALGASARAASRLGRDAIAPLHLVQGVLEIDEALRATSGWTSARLRLASAGLDEDRTPLPTRTLSADPALANLLEGLPEGAQTLDVLAAILAQGNREVAALLRRQKVTEGLVERCRGVLVDPEESPP
jgi:ATP-dependent Clp protease ATP-binding subunit ClpA